MTQKKTIAKNSQKTFFTRAEDVERQCFVIDAKDKVLGRVATKAAHILRGKHKVTYTPHIDNGDMVVIINAEKIKVTGRKLEQKEYGRHSGYPGGKKLIPLAVMLKNRPEQVMKLAVNRMIPSGPLGNQLRGKLRVYAGDQHPHIAQKPVVVEV
ncbi:MAG: 50S ribosomal protein L13 [Candidatus Omnitrophota bacterium]|nr:50S ribosomal protein L13 [Candidatus Omnitrophota bacterium]